MVRMDCSGCHDTNVYCGSCTWSIYKFMRSGFSKENATAMQFYKTCSGTVLVDSRGIYSRWEFSPWRVKSRSISVCGIVAEVIARECGWFRVRPWRVQRVNLSAKLEEQLGAQVAINTGADFVRRGSGSLNLGERSFFVETNHFLTSTKGSLPKLDRKKVRKMRIISLARKRSWVGKKEILVVDIWVWAGILSLRRLFMFIGFDTHSMQTLEV